jgi:hypothetical protein
MNGHPLSGVISTLPQSVPSQRRAPHHSLAVLANSPNRPAHWHQVAVHMLQLGEVLAPRATACSCAGLPSNGTSGAMLPSCLLHQAPQHFMLHCVLLVYPTATQCTSHMMIGACKWHLQQPAGWPSMVPCTNTSLMTCTVVARARPQHHLTLQSRLQGQSSRCSREPPDHLRLLAKHSGSA